MSSYHTTFPQLLKTAGYSTALFGKWHLGTNSSGVLPKKAGFELYKGNNDGALGNFWSYTYHVQDDSTSDTFARTDPTPSKALDGIAATTFATVVQAADTIEWINARKAANPDKPWFVYLAFNEAHSPMHVPNADTLDTTSYNEVIGCGGTPGTANKGSCNNKQLTRAMSNALDTVVGKVLDAVDAIGSDTYVIFIGDNGTDVSTTSPNSLDNMYITTSGRGKGTVYESGARVAMAFRGPGIAAGTRKNEFVHVADLSATILTLAGLTPPATNRDSNNNVVDSDSKSLTPMLFGSASSVRDPNEGYLLTETSYNGNKVGARNATYKVVCPTNTSNCTFYNLVDDPLEEYPLSKPGSCTNYRTTYTTSNPEWHYCRLIEVVTNYSIF